ncbi:MAG: 50S ribosomal protein L23, partial [Armatimonadota bacterium]
MPDLYQVIQRPVITEKALTMNGERKYAFIVHPEANKIEIRAAVEALFTTPEGGKLSVTDVNTIRVKGRTKRYRLFGRMSVGKTPTIKKAVVTVAEGQ